MADAKEKQKKEDVKEENAHFMVSFFQLFKYADRLDVGLMALGSLGAIGLGLAMPLMTLVLGQLTDAFGNNVSSPSRLASDVSNTALKFVWLALAAALSGYLEMSCWMMTGERQSSRIRSRYLKAILRQDMTFFDLEVSTGELVERMSGDVVLVQEAMGEKVGAMLRFLAMFVGGFSVAFYRGWLLTLVMTGCLPFLSIGGVLITNAVSKAAGKGQEAYGAAGSLMEEYLGAIRTVMSFTGETLAVKRYKEKLSDAYLMGCKQGFFSGLAIGFTLLIMFCSYSLALWFGSYLIIHDIGNYTGGKVLTVLLSVIIGGMSLGQAAPSISAISAGRAAAFKIFQTIVRIPDIDVYNEEGEKPSSVEGFIELKEVSFSYPSRPQAAIFTSLSLVVPAGKTLALVGQSGSGKSSVLSLLQRLYDPLQGSITLDGRDLRNLNLKWLRSQMGLVSQEPVLFGTTILDNIAFGREGASRESMEEAARLANVHSFVTTLPQGYDTLVGERGVQLSGGQKQRVAIARAILRNPRILLLDEATSALDAESEHSVQEALDKAMEKRTTIVVAHRLSTIKNADRIAVLRDGQLVEEGKHEELLSNPQGAYFQLIHLQQSGGDKEEVKKSMISTSHPGTTILAGGNGAINGTLTHEANGAIAVGDLVLSRNAEPLVRKAVNSTLMSVTEGVKDAKGDEESGELGSSKQEKSFVLRLAHLNKPEWPYALIGSVGAIVQGCTFPLFAILLSRIIRSLYLTDKGKLRDRATFWALMFLVLAGTCLVSVLTQLWMFAIVGSALVRRVRSLCVQKILEQEIGWFDRPENSSGAIGARLSTDAAQVRAMVGDNLALVVQNLATITAGLIIAFTANWTLALVVLSAVPLLGFAGFMQMRALQGFADDAKVMYEDASRVANNAVSSIRTVVAFGAEQKMVALYEDKCKVPIAAGLRKGQVSGIGLGFSNFALFSVYALAFWYGGQLVKEGKTTFQDVFQVFFAIVMSAVGVSQSASLAKDATEVKLAVRSIFAILDRESEIDPNAPGKELASINGDIELVNVRFAYPSRPDVLIFDDFSLSISQGQSVALVGESGSGKSTVVSLIQRFYDPFSGSVLIDGIDVKSFQLKWLRQQMGLVSQEPVLFNTSIRDNIAYGKVGEVTEEEIRKAAEVANAHKFVSELPEGYNTLVGERGVQLSGGQKQRVAIARAILRNPRILLLDEATSALDAESEHLVQDALEKAMEQRTTLVVAHRLSTIKNATCIAVMSGGKVLEKGSHNELLERGGAYNNLVQLQTG